MTTPQNTFTDMFVGYERDNNVVTLTVKNHVSWDDVNDYLEDMLCETPDDSHWEWKGWGFSNDEFTKMNKKIVVVVMNICDSSLDEKLNTLYKFDKVFQ